ncbi:hypothetical protein C0J52_13341 [Blattella germanica]|nr:hypothetical protein C0J52_13341 [Blattella germanica]
MVSAQLFLLMVAILFCIGLLTEVDATLPCFGGRCFSPFVCRRFGLIDLCVLP